jgi:CubicO group peptidase (beta-lactamase class C family)
MLNEGTWNGTQIVPASWVERSTTPIPQMSNYGFLWWIDKKRGNFAATGSLDNVCIVFPDLNLVVARMQRDLQPDAKAKYQSVETLQLLRRIVEGRSSE